MMHRILNTQNKSNQSYYHSKINRIFLTLNHMKTSIQLSHKVKKIIVHIIVGILLLRTFNITGIIYAGATDLLKYELYTYLVIIIGFYIHSLLLLPLLTLKENPKRYLSFLIPIFLIVTYSVTWIRAMQSSEMVITIEGDPLSPEYFFDSVSPLLCICLWD